MHEHGTVLPKPTYDDFLKAGKATQVLAEQLYAQGLNGCSPDTRTRIAFIKLRERLASLPSETI